MPRVNPKAPPKAMTWPKAGLVMAFAVIFDAARIFFTMFWFFGPALAAAWCTSKVGDFWLVGAALGKACDVGAAAIATAGFGPLAAFGTIMAMAFGFIGFLILGALILGTNPRLFATGFSAKLQFIGGFMAAELPLIGAIPTFSISLWRLYKVQIKKESASLRAWQKAHAAEELRERQAQSTALMQARAAQEATNDAQYAQQSDNDEQYTQDEALAA